MKPRAPAEGDREALRRNAPASGKRAEKPSHLIQADVDVQPVGVRVEIQDERCLVDVPGLARRRRKTLHRDLIVNRWWIGEVGKLVWLPRSSLTDLSDDPCVVLHRRLLFLMIAG